MIDLIGYRRIASFKELWAAFDEAQAPLFISAGCTDLIPKSRAGVIPPGTWLDVRPIPELTTFEIDGDQLTLGACVTHHQVASHPRVQQELTALTRACSMVGSRQIRTLGTLGGNAANCSPCADSLLALIALDATVRLRSPEGVRTIAAADFPRGPGESSLEAQEIIESFSLKLGTNRRSSFVKLGPRRAVSVAKVSASASALINESGELSDLRLILGSVAPTALRIVEAEKLVEGTTLGDEVLREVARTVEETVKPIDDVRSTAEYRRITSGVLAKRALLALLDT